MSETDTRFGRIPRSRNRRPCNVFSVPPEKADQKDGSSTLLVVLIEHSRLLHPFNALVVVGGQLERKEKKKFLDTHDAAYTGYIVGDVVPTFSFFFFNCVLLVDLRRATIFAPGCYSGAFLKSTMK